MRAQHALQSLLGHESLALGEGLLLLETAEDVFPLVLKFRGHSCFDCCRVLQRLGRLDCLLQRISQGFPLLKRVLDRVLFKLG